MSAVPTTPKPYAVICTRSDQRPVEYSRFSRLMDAIKTARRLRGFGMPCAVRRVKVGQ